MYEPEHGEGSCEISGHEVAIVHADSQKPWLPAGDLSKTENSSIPQWDRKGLRGHTPPRRAIAS